MHPHVHVFSALFLITNLFFTAFECRREIDISECQVINFLETPFPFFYVDELTDLNKPVIHLLFDRDDLAVTSYVGTPSVNLVIQNLAVVVIGNNNFHQY